MLKDRIQEVSMEGDIGILLKHMGLDDTPIALEHFNLLGFLPKEAVSYAAENYIGVYDKEKNESLLFVNTNHPLGMHIRNDATETIHFLNNLYGVISKIEDSYQPNAVAFRDALEPLVTEHYWHTAKKIQSQVSELYSSLDASASELGVITKLKNIYKEFSGVQL